MKKLLLVIGLAVMLACTAGTAGAFSLDGSGNATDGTSTANFAIVGGNLQVTLSTTSVAVVPTDVLTALFFSITGDPGLTSLSAVLGSGSFITAGGTTDAGGGVGGEWAYSNGLSVAQFPGANSGISSTGLGVFGSPTFPGTNLAGPAAVDGGQYGMVGGIAANANTPVKTDPLIENTVVFTLGGFSGALGDIDNVGFQYGTSLGEVPPQVPEPGMLLLLGSGLAGLAFYRRRKA